LGFDWVSAPNVFLIDLDDGAVRMITSVLNPTISSLRESEIYVFR